jgi:purine-nucleoside phosphorylase
MSTPTPHIQAKDQSNIAKTVLMPGDPLRAKFIADTFLTDVVQFNAVRGALGYTGVYQGKRISVMGSGMGMPSIGIYSYELYAFYGVEQIIRIGSCGAYTADLNCYDILLAKDAWSESTFAQTLNGYREHTIDASPDLNKQILTLAENLKLPVVQGRIHSSDVFYRHNFNEYQAIRDEHGCIAVEMESFALFANAKELGKKAACILTVSDNLVTAQATTSDERQNAFTNMMKLALEMGESE